MFLTPIPKSTDNFNARQWESFEPYFKELIDRPVTADTVNEWLNDWSDLSRLFGESVGRIYINASLDTASEEAEAAYMDIISAVIPPAQKADQTLKEKLLALGLQESRLDLMLMRLQSEADLFREENIPLQSELSKMGNEYDKITGALKVDWDGEEKNLSQLTPLFQDKDRAVRERVWHVYMEQWQEARPELNELFLKMLKNRRKIAQNAGFDDYRSYSFRNMGRFDYEPADCLTFHEAIEKAVVPVVTRILERTRQELGSSSIRPWDWMPEKGLFIETGSAEPLAPYETEEELVAHSINIFNKVDPELGRFFVDMAESGMLDLQSRKGKAMGGFCYSLPLQRRPFIFMNGVGTHDCVQTLLHEAGHAFHAYEAYNDLVWYEDVPMEFCEVASMSMELLAGPYLSQEHGGFYTEKETARARIEHLQKTVLFLPYMAAVDAFQHWLYTTDAEITIEALDAKWLEMEQRFMPMADWDGLDKIRSGGWHRKLHIFQIPFYYIEYGMASIGALQVWRNSLTQGPEAALASYREGLALGGTKTLPELFESAGASFRFDAGLLTELMELVEQSITELEAI